MVYFEVSRLGFNCGVDKANCANYPSYCAECVKEKLMEIGLEVNSGIRIYDMDSEGKRVEMFRDIIWQKFLNVLNIKHIILMDKISGLEIINYPVSGTKMDLSIVSGFIQANINFSESRIPEQGKNSKNILQFYELQYQDFNMLIKEGNLCRICMILDSKANSDIKKNVLDFLYKFETKFQNNLLNLQKKGMFNFSEAIEFIVDVFNINLVFPMTLTHTIAPDTMEEISNNDIKKAVIQVAKELLTSKPFFFIYNLLDTVQKLVNKESKVILYEIFLLLEAGVIVPTTLETAVTDFKVLQETRAKKVEDTKVISSIIINDEDALNGLKEKINEIDYETAENLMKQFVKKAKTAEKASIYQEAKKEYEKALYLADKLKLEKKISSISSKISDINEKINRMEFIYTMRAGESAEKKKDYINSINHFKKAVQILEQRVVSEEVVARIKKLNKKIAKLQASIK